MQLLLGNNLDLIQTLADNSVDSIVTDPPYGLGKEPDALAMLADWILAGYHDVKSKSGFMGKEWDAFVPQPVLWKECLRVLKPGGHLLAFGGTRTYDLVTLGLRIAGFEIRDTLQYVFGSGFPKSLNVSKAIDSALGKEPKAEQWQGWGSALKPAYEPIVMARKPLDGTIAANTLKWGVGGINIDGCRVELQLSGEYSRLGDNGTWSTKNAAKRVYKGGYAGDVVGSSALGRFPANFLHDGSDEVRALFPDSKGQQGDLLNHTRHSESPNGIYGKIPPKHDAIKREESDTSAARFFYCAKASQSERNMGLPDGQFNRHATVKPLTLMRYLARLVTPPGGTCLDPYMGSGTTGLACIAEGFDFIGMEMEEPSFVTAKARIEGYKPEPTEFGNTAQLELF